MKKTAIYILQHRKAKPKSQNHKKMTKKQQDWILTNFDHLVEDFIDENEEFDDFCNEQYDRYKK